MKISITESHSGEFNKEDIENLLSKGFLGLQSALEEALGHDCGHLPSHFHKSLPERGGEMDVIMELADHTVKAYNDRMQQLTKAILAKVDEAIEEIDE
jgi:hypothetical protein